MGAPRDRVLANALTVACTLVLLLCVSLRAFKSGIFQGFEANLLFAMLILTCTCLYAMRALLLRSDRLVRTGTELAALAFAVLCVASVFVAAEKPGAFAVALNWVSYLALFYLVVHISQRDHTWRLIFAVTIATAVVVSVYAVYQVHFEWPRSLAEFRKVKQLYHNDPQAMAEHFRRSISLDVPPDGMADYEGRLVAVRAIGTFVLPNSFAGYLILLLPAVVGYVHDLCRPPHSRLRLAAIAVNAAAAFAISAALIYTKSKGAWICLIAVVACWLTWRWRKRLPIRARWLVAAAFAVMLLFGWLQAAGLLPEPCEYLGSFWVRTDYWRGGAKIVAERPWLGVGLDGFGENYGRHIRPQDDESIRAHNNYLQIWCEMGVFGLAAFVAFWASFWKGASRGSGQTLPCDKATEREKALAILGAAVGPAAIVMEHLFFGHFDITGWPAHSFQVLLAAVWLICYTATMAAAMPPGFGPGFRTGLLLGVACFLVHCLVDIDLYVPSLTQTAWVVAGLAMSVGVLGRHENERERESIRVPPRVRWAAGGALVVLALFCALFFMPRVMRAKLHRDQGLAYERKGRLDEAVQEWALARQYDPWDVKLTLRLSRAYLASAAEQHGLRARLELLGLAAEAATEATRLNSASAACQAQLGHVFEETARALVRTRGMAASAAKAMSSAAHQYEQAIERYPSKPIYHFRAATSYARLNRRQQAAAAFKEAVELSGRQRLPRNELSQAQLVHARKYLAASAAAPARPAPTRKGADGDA